MNVVPDRRSRTVANLRHCLGTKLRVYDIINVEELQAAR